MCTERREELCRQLVALGGAREELVGLVGPHGLGLAQIAETHQSCGDTAALGVLQNWQEVVATNLIVLHFARVQMEVAQNRHSKLVRIWE